LPGAAKNIARAKNLLNAVTVLSLVSLGLPILLCLALLSPILSFAYFFLWLISLTFDFYTTWRFYTDDPSKFEVRERSAFIRWFNRSLGFKKALLAFALFVEAPVGLFISFICVPPSAELIDVQPPGLRVCLATGLALLGLIHLYAAVKNLVIEVAEKKRP
jgi:hypothetical protein